MNSYERACNNSNFFDTSDFLSISLHWFGCIAIPVHLFGAYCILFQTPTTMKSIKLTLLNFHFWTCFMDFGLSLLSTPYVFVPALAGYPLGLLSVLGVGTAEQVYIMLSAYTIVTVSIIGLFEKRFFILKSNSSLWKVARIPLYIFNHIVALSCFLISYLKTPDQKMAFDLLRSLTSCIPPYVDPDRIFFFSVRIRWVLIPGAICFFYLYSQVIFFPVLTNRILSRRTNKNMSMKTAKIQKKFQKALIFQVALPITIFAIPFAYLGIASTTWYHNQAYNNISFIIISSHGFFSTLSMISLHSAYREFTLSLFCFRTWANQESSVANNLEMRPSFIT